MEDIKDFEQFKNEMNEAKKEAIIPFYNFIQESLSDEDLIQLLNENYKHNLTEKEEKEINVAVEKFVDNFLNEGKSLDDLEEELMKEGFIGSILGGLTGFALGKAVGKVLASVLGLEKGGILYDLFTSRLVGAALGSALGKRI